MTKPLQYPEKYTLPMRHIHHSTIVWLDSVILQALYNFDPLALGSLSRNTNEDMKESGV